MSRERLRRLRRRELAPREIAELLRHIGECDACVRIAAADAAAEVDALRAAMQADGAALRRARSRRNGWRVALGAAAAATIAFVLVLQRRADLPSSPLPVVTTHAAATATIAPAFLYANAEWERLVRTAVITATLPFPRETELASDSLRGSGGSHAPEVSPTGTLDETRPRFSWPTRTGAQYVVSIFDGTDQVAQSEPLPVTRWKPPRPLPRGRTYVWQVLATRDGAREIIPAPPAPPATFRIVSKRDHEELAEARRAHPEDHVLHAVLAARAGLRDDAVDALRRARDGAAQALIETYVTAEQ